jgi:hypothetical protein
MFVSGRLDLTVPNTPTPLVAANATAARRITNVSIQAPKENSGPVAIGGSDVLDSPLANATGIFLYPGDTESFSATDAADVFVSGAAGDAVRFRAKAI